MAAHRIHLLCDQRHHYIDLVATPTLQGLHLHTQLLRWLGDYGYHLAFCGNGSRDCLSVLRWFGFDTDFGQRRCEGIEKFVAVRKREFSAMVQIPWLARD